MASNNFVYSTITQSGIIRLIFFKPSKDLGAEIECLLVDASL
jgi:hypothetical protein